MQSATGTATTLTWTRPTFQRPGRDVDQAQSLAQRDNEPPRPARRVALLVVFLLEVFGHAVGVDAQHINPIDHPAIAYSSTPRSDRVAALRRRIETGQTALEYDARHGYLSSLLEALDVPISSQVLVFSRTSLQVDKIAPWSPRAIYFNDDIYIAWVQGGPMIEIASVDPKLGAVFYTLPQTPPAEAPSSFEEETSTCLMCHDSSATTGGVPGFIVRSVLADRYGYPIAVNERPTTDRTAPGERWGGWYVSGDIEGGRHGGNVHSPMLSHEVGNARVYAKSFEPPPQNPDFELSDKFDVAPYLASYSDLVALMVLSHQTSIHNLITRVHYETLKALHEERPLLIAAGKKDEEHLPSTLARIERACESLVLALLFSREAALPGRARGRSEFATEFASLGPKDDNGRSLRDFDLSTRLFRHRLSFLIYSESFNALPPIAKHSVYRRVRDVLEAEESRPGFEHLGSSERKHIAEILTATKPDYVAARSEGEELRSP